MSSPRTHSSTAMAIHAPGSPSTGTSSSASPMRTIQMLPRFMRLGTSVSPAPRSARRHDGDAEERLRQKLHPQHPHGQLPYLLDGREHPEHERAEEDHQKSRAAHQKAAQGGADAAVALGERMLARADAASDQRGGGGRETP